ncbi:MAG: T9SS type A sorting domain-containing protein [Bacteroidales bacterium]|jgi:hypothetical protein|nr:T9SS type A sorting domain-containing protein [Bacteroidales bacterium]
MKRLLVGIFLLLLCHVSYTQKLYNLSHQVLVPAGNLVTHTGLTYQQTVGETAVEVSLPSFYNLSQGFQQPRFIPPQNLPDREGNGVDFFPNPVTENNNRMFYIRVYGVLARHYKIYICNLIGSLMYTAELDLSADHDYIHEISLARYGNGIYIVNVTSTDGVINRSFKIDKL